MRATVEEGGYAPEDAVAGHLFVLILLGDGVRWLIGKTKTYAEPHSSFNRTPLV
ncbi:MAG: hypothetical protein H6Q76_2567 [Firmicutes bacterium]|nr:hypothetical protein [Bacillota bacterium]